MKDLQKQMEEAIEQNFATRNDIPDGEISLGFAVNACIEVARVEAIGLKRWCEQNPDYDHHNTDRQNWVLYLAAKEGGAK